MKTFKLGIDVLQEQNFEPLAGKRVGLYTNASGVDSRLRSTYDILLQAENVNLVAFFAPEHGFAAVVQDAEHIYDMVDSHTGIPIFSLYGDTFEPTEEMLSQVDVVVIDIQDIGVRYYTFMWTMTYVLEACGKYNVETIILDRPNPLGEWHSYPVLDEAVSSFVGRFPVPVVHGMTMGEMAQMANGEWLEKPAPLNVIKCQNYTHEMNWWDTELSWVPSSPNMPHLSTLYHYVGSCLIEGTNLSEGRGTTLPFEIVGAPWIDGQRLADEVNQNILKDQAFDAIARPHSFEPTFSKFANEVCHGLQLHTQDYEIFDSLGVWLDIIDTIRHMYPEEFEFLAPFDIDKLYHFERLIGIPDFRLVDNFNEVINTDENQTKYNQFIKASKPYMLYTM